MCANIGWKETRLYEQVEARSYESKFLGKTLVRITILRAVVVIVIVIVVVVVGGGIFTPMP